MVLGLTESCVGVNIDMQRYTLTTPLAQEYSVAAQVPGPTNLGYSYFINNAFTRLPDGTFVAAGPRYVQWNAEGRAAHEKTPEVLRQSEVMVSVSADGGETWRHSTSLKMPDLVGTTLFHHEGRLYLLIIPKQIDAGRVRVAVSDDGGESWSEPVEVISSTHKWFGGHQQSMVVENGQLYWAVSEEFREIVILACDLKQGLQNPRAWRMSNRPLAPRLNASGDESPRSMGCLEANVIRVDGRLRVSARATISRCGTPNMAALYDLEDDGEELKLAFDRYYPLPGGQCKFFIVYDEPSKLFWMASNPIAKVGNDRRFLMLWYGCDGLNWFPAGCIARARQLDESFMYPSMVVDGEDLAVLSRTSRDARHYHDSDLLTFHRVRDFRSLAMDLWPVE